MLPNPVSAFLNIAGRWRWQRPNRRRLIMEFDVGVGAQGQPDVAVPGEGLGHAGRDAGPLEARDEEMPEAVKAGIQSGMLTTFEIRFQAATPARS